MSARKITSQFTTDLLTGSLGELRARRAKLQKFIAEADELDLAIREVERCFARLGLDSAASGERRPLAAVPAAATPKAPTPVAAGTNADRALELLRSHPRGLNTTVIRDEAGIAAGSISVVLAQLVERGHAEKVGRGFWRAKQPAADAA